MGGIVKAAAETKAAAEAKGQEDARVLSGHSGYVKRQRCLLLLPFFKRVVYADY